MKLKLLSLAILRLPYGILQHLLLYFMVFAVRTNVKNH